MKMMLGDVVLTLRPRTWNARVEAVRLAARELDAEFSDAEWGRRVVVSSLDMATARRCVLGQLYGDYFSPSAREFRRRAEANGVPEWAFNPYAPHPSAERLDRAVRVESALLRQCWAREVERRRRVRPVVVPLRVASSTPDRQVIVLRPRHTPDRARG